MQCKIALDGRCSLVSYAVFVLYFPWQRAEIVSCPSGSQIRTRVQRDPAGPYSWCGHLPGWINSGGVQKSKRLLCLFRVFFALSVQFV